MIFITLGSQKFQFNRLLKEMDNLIENEYINEDVIAQTGYSDYKPLNYKYKNFFSRDEFNDLLEKCDLVITHGGTGAIVNALKLRKKVIAIPRKAEFKEHVDNHQTQIINQFEKLGYIIGGDCDDLQKMIKRIRNIELKNYESNTQKIIDSIEEFMEEI